MQKSYSEHTAYYKRLIAQINTEADFPAYLQQSGYKLLKKSAGSLEFDNGEDRIVLNMARNPVTYFNRNDSTDKGLLFKFIRKQHGNFYGAVKVGLEIIDRTYAFDEKTFTIKGSPGPSKPLDENYHIVPLRKTGYLTRTRKISQSVLDDGLFRGRIFNAFHITDKGEKFDNIAFPKYDLDGNPKNYILYNRPYFDRRENKRKKFRLTLNGNDHFLFRSKPISNPKRIVLGESAPDLLSYHELHGSPDNLYISFGGNVYPKKLSFFTELVKPFVDDNNVRFLSIMDNDNAGREFDIKVFSALVNHCRPNVHIDQVYSQGRIRLSVRYAESYGKRISEDKSGIDAVLKSQFKNNGLSPDLVRTFAFAEKLVLEFSLVELAGTSELQDKNAFKLLLETIGKLYLPFAFGLHKSKGKDWNDDLRESKKHHRKTLHTASGKLKRKSKKAVKNNTQSIS